MLKRALTGVRVLIVAIVTVAILIAVLLAYSIAGDKSLKDVLSSLDENVLSNNERSSTSSEAYLPPFASGPSGILGSSSSRRAGGGGGGGGGGGQSNPPAPSAQCSDGVDNDGDGWIDYDADGNVNRTDSGCDNAEDNDELFVENVQCSDNNDNDADNFTDGNDIGCVNAQDDNETETGGSPAFICGNEVTELPETCDAGDKNGVLCSQVYGSGCTYCDSLCQLVTLTGPSCGDSKINGNEQCDGDDFGSYGNGTILCSVYNSNYTTGALSCNSPGTASECMINVTACAGSSAPFCGDGQVNGNEQCDGTNFNGQTCASVLGAGYTGSMACSATCTLDTSGCQAVVDNPPSSLVAYYPFDYSFKDSSGNGNDGILNGIVDFVPGYQGQGASFDGVNGNCVTLPSNALDLRNSLSISAWVNTALTNVTRAILSKGSVQSSAGNEQYSLILSRAGGEVFRFRVSNGTSFLTAAAPLSPSIDQWHHVAGIFDGTSVYLYVDGLLVTSNTNANFGILNSRPAIAIGCEGGGVQNVWDGMIDELSVYNRALTAGEVSGLYNNDAIIGLSPHAAQDKSLFERIKDFFGRLF